MRHIPVLILAILVASGTAGAQFGGPAAVRVAPVERHAREVVQPLVASVEPVTQATLAAEQAGLVVKRNFDHGSALDKGQVLVEMDVELLRIQREAAEAARQALAGALEQAKVRSENSQREAERLRGLLQQRNAPEKEYRDALTMSRVDAAIVTTRTAEMAEKKAEVDRLEATIRKSIVRSPLDGGVVARRHVEVGQWVKQGDPVADVVVLDPVFVIAYVPEDVIAKIRKGDEARVTFDALGEERFTGTVEQIIPTADPGSRTFPVKVLLKNPKHLIRPGFFARATLLAKSEADLYAVPRDAVISVAGKSHVVAARDGKAVVVAVKVTGGAGNAAYVTGDFKDGDRVVIRGNETLRGGEPLAVEGDPPAPPAPPAGQSPGGPNATSGGKH